MDNNTDLTFYLNTQLGSAICLMVLSPITIISNVLLLLTIFKDPLKCFRTPATYFIVALALVDFTTGVCFEPFFLMYQIKQYTTWSLKLDQPYASLAFFGTLYTYVPVASSYIFVLGLTLSQYIAISFPRATLSLNRDDAQGYRLYCYLVRVFHHVHLIILRWSLNRNLV